MATQAVLVYADSISNMQSYGGAAGASRRSRLEIFVCLFVCLISAVLTNAPSMIPARALFNLLYFLHVRLLSPSCFIQDLCRVHSAGLVTAAAHTRNTTIITTTTIR